LFSHPHALISQHQDELARIFATYKPSRKIEGVAGIEAGHNVEDSGERAVAGAAEDCRNPGAEPGCGFRTESQNVSKHSIGVW